MIRSTADRRARARTLCGSLISALLFWVPCTAPAGIKIEIPEVSPAIATNVREFLSLTRYADRTDITEETMSRLQRRIVAETRRALEPLGFYEPEVSYEFRREKDDWIVTIHITPGRPVRLSEVTILTHGPGEHERALRDVIDAQELKPGLRLNHGTYERVKGSLVRAAKNAGYIDAKLTRHELIIDRASRRATMTIDLETGEQYRYGEIKIVQDVIDESAMRRLLRMKEGDPYTLDSMLRTQYVLDDSQYFSAVDIESSNPNRETRIVPVTVRAEPNRRHRFATSLGYGTDTDVRGKFTWDNRRVNRAGHRFKLELLASSIVKEIIGRYAIPVMDIALEKLEFFAGYKEEELGDTLSERVETGAGLTQVQGRWQRVLFLRFSNETTIEADGTADTHFYVYPGISYSTLPSYIVGGRARPYFVYAELKGSPATFGSDASFLQFRMQVERVFDLSALYHLHLLGEVGATKIDQASNLPASQRFFAGGERSVRGFSLNELSPKDEEGRAVGGRHLASGSVEIERDLPKNFGVATFFDIGNAFDDFKDPRFEYSVGVGIRYNVAVASFGIDVAQALSESGRGPKLHLYILTQF
jgi:translocation and assembly module TamA